MFNSNGPTTSRATCKLNTNKLKNVTNKLCIKTATNAWLKKINRVIYATKEINRAIALIIITPLPSCGLRRLLCFHCVPLSTCPVPTSALFTLRKYWTEFDETWSVGNHYHQWMNWLHFGWNCTREKRAGYDRKFESVKLVLPRSKWLHSFCSTYGTLHPQGWLVHYIHAEVEALYDGVRRADFSSLTFCLFWV